MRLLYQLLETVGLSRPDGRPLYAVPLSPEQHAALEASLKADIRTRRFPQNLGPSFVLWAAEYIRSSFPGGPLTWQFVVTRLGLPEDRSYLVSLVEDGLRWWQRSVRVSDTGIRLYLYSLMAEGGLPQALLMQPGLHQRVIKGLVSEIEREGPDAPPAVVHQIAARRVSWLPQTFHSKDIVQLLGDLATALVMLRRLVPGDVPWELSDRWLDAHRPDWLSELPLRMSREVADSLVRPALRSDRKAPISNLPLAIRKLVYNLSLDEWVPVIEVQSRGTLPYSLLPNAHGMRLRLMPQGEAAEGCGQLIFSANPDDEGWSLARLGSGAPIRARFPIDRAFSLMAFSDGRAVGEVEILPASPPLEDFPSFWHSTEREPEGPTDLVSLAGGSTPSTAVWILSGGQAGPSPVGDVSVSGPFPAQGGRLWRVSGKGVVDFSGRQTRIETTSPEETASAQLMINGPALPGWRLRGNNGLLLSGEPTLIGQRGLGTPRLLAQSSLNRSSSRSLWSVVLEWIESQSVVARASYVAVPHGISMLVRETDAGRIELSVTGLADELSCRLSAGDASQTLRPVEGKGTVSLSVPGIPPGLITLSISDRRSGKNLELIAPWPARKGMLLSPKGHRVNRNVGLAVDGLRGWRAVVPAGAVGDLQLRLSGHSPVAVRVSGEVSFVAHASLIRSLLAWGGPDAEVCVSLVVDGEEGRRIEVRRYDKQPSVTDDHLRLEGAGRDPTWSLQSPFMLTAISISDPTYRFRHELRCDEIDLREVLPDHEGPWLIQSSLDGKSNRPVVWSPVPQPSTTRRDRIEAYCESINLATTQGDARYWDQLWQLIKAVREGGDPGALDQVQALSVCPTGAIALALHVSAEDVAEVFELEDFAPIFWPCLPISSYGEALRQKYQQTLRRYGTVLDPEEAQEEADRRVGQGLRTILSLRPDLAGHFGLALAQADLIRIALQLAQQGGPGTLFVGDPVKTYSDRAQEAARRFERLPSGVRLPQSSFRPQSLSFNPYAQPVIDAPLVAAELALGLRTDKDVALMLSLINLRMADPQFFDSALPSALALVHDKAPK